MHELPVITRIMDICLRHAQKGNVNKILAIELKVGPLSDLEPEWMQRYFDFVSKDTIAAGARLEIEKTPLVYRCDGCAREFEADLTGKEIACPKCSGGAFSIVSGDGYFVGNMRVM
jgi:hydrogenase nickel incorporation protein HypA/HybF